MMQGMDSVKIVQQIINFLISKIKELSLREFFLFYKINEWLGGDITRASSPNRDKALKI